MENTEDFSKEMQTVSEELKVCKRTRMLVEALVKMQNAYDLVLEATRDSGFFVLEKDADRPEGFVRSYTALHSAVSGILRDSVVDSIECSEDVSEI